jgi:hypothetical protein
MICSRAQELWSWTGQPFPAGKFVVDGCNSRKGREFLLTFPQKFDPVNATKRISKNLHNGDRLYINSSTCSSSHVSHSKRKPPAPSTKTLSIFGTFIWSLCLVITFPISLKGTEYNKLTKPQQGFQISSKSTSETLLSFTGELVETTILQIVQKARREKEYAKCKSVWPSCKWQHDISICQYYRKRDLNFDDMFTDWISTRPLTACSTLACVSYRK